MFLPGLQAGLESCHICRAHMRFIIITQISKGPHKNGYKFQQGPPAFLVNVCCITSMTMA